MTLLERAQEAKDQQEEQRKAELASVLVKRLESILRIHADGIVSFIRGFATYTIEGLEFSARPQTEYLDLDYIDGNKMYNLRVHELADLQSNLIKQSIDNIRNNENSKY